MIDFERNDMNSLYSDACTIVVHMQNIFNDRYVYPTERIYAAKKVIEKSRKEKIPVIYIQSILPTTEYRMDIMHSLKPESGDIVLRGIEEDGFQGTGLRAELKKRNTKKLVMIGCNANACYGKTFNTASIDAEQYKIIVPKDAIMDQTEGSCEGALEYFQRYAIITDSDNFLKEL